MFTQTYNKPNYQSKVYREPAFAQKKSNVNVCRSTNPKILELQQKFEMPSKEYNQNISYSNLKQASLPEKSQKEADKTSRTAWISLTFN